ncbi:hypothetical protein LCGC14_1754160 [marine sediment metagenome]|uniref:JAB domain-containing protein n=1 Tax=marine sediment metagenome TaxID=412755 RepID=A0A0F9JI57_9ZZZZ
MDKGILDRIISCVENSYPDEAFGLILGPQPKEISLGISEEFQYHYIGEKFECVESSEKSPVSFLMNDTIKLFEIFENAIKKYNRRVISIFHSHPSGARPSGFDINYMKFLDESYSKIYNSAYKAKMGIKNQIWTIMDSSNKDLNGFIYLHDELMQIAIEIKD